MLKRHVTLMHPAEGVQPLRADDLPRVVRPGGASSTGRQVQECPCGREIVLAEATGDIQERNVRPHRADPDVGQ